MKVYLGADHHGFFLKDKIKSWLSGWNYDFEDLGAFKLDIHDDYTLFAEKVGSLIAKEKSSRGILLCGSGVGVDIAVNKLDGVRASLGKSSQQIKAGRRDDDMNILVIAADFTNDNEAKEMIKMFLQTKFDQKVRHKRRLEDIKRLEANN